MKQLFLLFLITIYSLSSFGVGIKEFYCCGKLKSVSLTIAKPSTDACKKGVSAQNCCETKIQYLQVKDRHVASVVQAVPAQQLVYLTPQSFYAQPTVGFAGRHALLSHGSHAPPPPLLSVPLYISHCLFRI